MSASRSLRLTLARFERDLIRKHGYPFPRVQAAIDAVPKDEDEADVELDAGEVEHLLGDLAYSINRCENPRLQLHLDELYVTIELELERQTRR